MTSLIFKLLVFFFNGYTLNANKECPNLFQPENGILEISSQNNIHLSYAWFECNPGYQIHGPIKMNCLDGEWIENNMLVTRCLSNENVGTGCSSPINKEDTQYHYLIMEGSFLNGGKLDLKCLSVDGFVNPENQTLTCIDGMWSAPPITCSGPPIPTDASVMSSETESESNNVLLYAVVSAVVVVLMVVLLCGIVTYFSRRRRQTDNKPNVNEAYEDVEPDNTNPNELYRLDNLERPQVPGAVELHEYDYLSNIVPTIRLSDVETEDELVRDKSGILLKGTVILPGSTRTQDVVARISRDNFTKNQMESLTREIGHLKTLENHQNVIKTVATISNSTNDCIGIVSEFATKGTLKEILYKRKKVKKSVGPYQILTYIKDVAKGLHFLHMNQFLQPSLKASKVLVFSSGVCKISNFGLKKIGDEQLYDLDQPSNKCRPSWFAPEVVTDKILSKESDIYTFGATLYEIFSFGEDPFENQSDDEIIMQLSLNKYTKESLAPIFKTPPTLCTHHSTKNMFELICKCCDWIPSNRPGFDVILRTVEAALVAAMKDQ